MGSFLVGVGVDWYWLFHRNINRLREWLWNWVRLRDWVRGWDRDGMGDRDRRWH
nr:hypothetical protein CPGR_02116 [Mycolicibacterium fortuitum subsp. fortuitum DSM 46621 = ATCC 6841 = JCM 6387]